MSFLEMMVSIVIFTIIVGSIFTVTYTGRLYWRVGTSQLDIQQQARQAVSFMAKELKQTRAGTGMVGGGASVAILEGLPTDDQPHTSVTFRIPFDIDNNGTVLNASGNVVDWSDKITYSLVNNQILRSVAGGGTKVLANNVSSLQFTRESGAPQLIEIKVITSKNIPGTTQPVTYTLSSWVHLEN